jgi:mycothiol system anti-sigma-R factor
MMEEALEMDSCSDHSLDILRYLDTQLTGSELEAFSAHLKTCKECTVQLEAEQALSRVLRNSGPLYTAPSALRARVSTVLNQAPARSSQRFPGNLLSAMRDAWRGLAHWAPSWSLALPVLLVIVAGLVILPGVTRQVSAASYVSAAAAAHRGYLDGNLPMEIRSESPEVVTAWFSGKLPFTFSLPSSQHDPANRSIYTLTGGRLVDYKGSQAAFVSYTSARKQPVSLLVASARFAAVAGGNEVHAGSLTFHYHTDDRFKVATWVSDGVAYALVSDVSGSQGSCLVCHQSMADHNSFRTGP